MKDYYSDSSGQYHKVGIAGQLSLFVSNDNIGTHWLVTRNDEVIYKNYYSRPSVRLLRQRESEWNLSFTRMGNKPKPFSATISNDTPKTWARYDNPAGDFQGRR